MGGSLGYAGIFPRLYPSNVPQPVARNLVLPRLFLVLRCLQDAYVTVLTLVMALLYGLHTLSEVSDLLECIPHVLSACHDILFANMSL